MKTYQTAPRTVKKDNNARRASGRAYVAAPNDPHPYVRNAAALRSGWK